MAHTETRRLVPGARNAVLFIHGIVGTPNHFRKLLPMEELVPADWSVWNLLLDGHGGSVRDFSNTSMKKWEDQVWDAFQKLAVTHERVLIAAHSMGTLFAIQLALEYPEKIPELFLVAVPMRPRVRFYGAVNCLRLVFGKIREGNPLETAARDACGVVTTRKLWQYLGWVPRYLELFSAISRTRRQLDCLRVPSIALQSKKDELVSNRARSRLEKCGVMKIVELPQSGHFYYAPEDWETVRDLFTECMKKHD